MNSIDLTPQKNVDTTQQQETEAPVIIIETDDTPAEPISKHHCSWRKITAITVAAVIALAACAYSGWKYYFHHYYVGMPVSCSPSENIEKLQMQTLNEVQPEVVMTSDSIGTVAINMYELRGLRGEITFTEPDTTDTDVFFYSRCADHGKDGKVLGSLVVNGEKKCNDNTRLDIRGNLCL